LYFGLKSDYFPIPFSCFAEKLPENAIFNPRNRYKSVNQKLHAKAGKLLKSDFNFPMSKAILMGLSQLFASKASRHNFLNQSTINNQQSTYLPSSLLAHHFLQSNINNSRGSARDREQSLATTINDSPRKTD